MPVIKEKNIESALDFAKGELRSSVPMRFFSEIISTIHFMDVFNSKIYLTVKNNFIRNQINSEIKTKLLSCINNKLDAKFDIEFVVESDKKTVLKFLKEKNSQKTINLVANFTKRTGLNKQLTFDSFVVGSFNENIYQMGINLLKQQNWKTFCVIGDIGQGKTHFLNAFGNLWFEQNKGSKVKYITSEEFVREFYNSFQGSSSVVQKLKDEYNGFDLLLFDDFDFINKKNKINEILISILINSKSQNQKFVFAMNDYPNLYSGIDKKLVSLLRSGLVYKIKEPTKEDFKKVLLKLIKNYDSTYSFSDEALFFIVNRCQNDLRVLEGITQRLMFSLMNKIHNEKIITIETIKKNTSQEMFDLNPKLSEVDPKTIIQEVCKIYNVLEEDIKSKSQEKIITHVRHVCIYVLKEKLDLNWTKIGSHIGSRAHSTVIEGYKKIKKTIEKDTSLKNYITKIYEKI